MGPWIKDEDTSKGDTRLTGAKELSRLLLTGLG